MSAASVTTSPATTYAGLLWPRRDSRAGTAVRAVILATLGACLLTISAKVQVPGPIPMTLQTLAVTAIGAMLGWRLGLAALVLYLAQGAYGLPVFANTPPMAAGPAYLFGPTGGFLLGFAVAIAMVGVAADRGLIRRPVLFGLVLAAANVALLAVGTLWLAYGVTLGGQQGVGLARAFEIGVRPFLLGNAIKLVLAAVALPLLYDALSRFARR